MLARLRTVLVSAGTAAVTAVAVLGVATPAFAKSDTHLSAPRVAHAGHAFRLTVWVDDDGGARTALTGLQLRGADGRYRWFGAFHTLRRTNRWHESFTFTVIENHPVIVTFRAGVSGGYAITNPVTVVVR
jgi:hypothetical protein